MVKKKITLLNFAFEKQKSFGSFSQMLAVKIQGVELEPSKSMWKRQAY